MSKFVIGVVAATLALAACGSSSKTGSSSGETRTANGSNGGSGDFSSLVAKAKTSPYKGTYKTSDDRTITIAQDGSGKQSVSEGNHLYINNGSTTISCDGTTSTATCHDLGSAGNTIVDAATAAFKGVYSAIAALGSSSVLNGQTSSETIAGRDATCVTVDAANMSGVFGAIARRLASDASTTVCADKETGVILKLSGGTGSTPTDVFVATEFGQPSDSDFQPPSTPKSAPTLPTLPSG